VLGIDNCQSLAKCAAQSHFSTAQNAECVTCNNSAVDSKIAEGATCARAVIDTQAGEGVTCGSTCAAPAPPEGAPAHSVQVDFAPLDITQALASDTFANNLDAVAPRGTFDLAVCFGFMHHLPRTAWRHQVLGALIDACAQGGFVAVSFWQFANSEKLLAKAQATTEQAKLALGVSLGASQTGDFLLGWQDRTDVWRYCHNFSDAEIDALLAAFAQVARPITRFSADGKQGNLNKYIVLQKL
jgi:hypothetical protein